MSQRFRIRLTQQALSDLEVIYASIAKDSPDNAARMIEKILNSIDLLQIFPHRTVVERQPLPLIKTQQEVGTRDQRVGDTHVRSQIAPDDYIVARCEGAFRSLVMDG